MKRIKLKYQSNLGILLILFVLSSCTSSGQTVNLEFLFFAPSGYANSRSSFFMIYDHENSIKGLIGPGKRSFRNEALLKQLSDKVSSINKKESLYLKYSVTVGRNGKRVQYLLTDDWLKVLKIIEENCPEEQLNALRAMIEISKQSKQSGYSVL